VEAAEALFEVLTHPRVAAKRVPVLLACNKMDQDTVVSAACMLHYACLCWVCIDDDDDDDDDDDCTRRS
jgi:hypothetical protein